MINKKMLIIGWSTTLVALPVLAIPVMSLMTPEVPFIDHLIITLLVWLGSGLFFTWRELKRVADASSK